mmetsp:Transcript_25259/g.34641  ORF Transcript_25259/g.34641 Transcript_25259/m.34641 type:complete len:169 (+) Transcript_25259:97-603(+)
MPAELEEAIRSDLKSKNRSTPTFTYGFYLPDGTLATSITNTVAIREAGYIRATTPPALSSQFAANSLQRLETLLRKKLIERVTSKYIQGETLLARSFEDLIARAANEHGVVERDAFQHLIRQVGLVPGDLNENEVDVLFDLLDQDGAGFVTVEAAADWWKGGKQADLP